MKRDKIEIVWKPKKCVSALVLDVFTDLCTWHQVCLNMGHNEKCELYNFCPEKRYEAKLTLKKKQLPVVSAIN